MTTSFCTIEFVELENDFGTESPAVYAICGVTGHRAGPVWGANNPSIRRALAILTKECDCGARFHEKASKRNNRLKFLG